MGQDPYPTPGHAIGLSFAVDARTRPIPRSLANIYRELESDLGIPARVHGDLSAWAGQGVLLLNRVMSVRAGAAGSHRGKGWEAITTAAVTAVANRRTADGGRPPLVAVLWGKDAEGVRPAAVRRGGGVQCAPQPVVGVARFLRLQAFQHHQRAAAGAGLGRRNLGAPPGRLA